MARDPDKRGPDKRGLTVSCSLPYPDIFVESGCVRLCEVRLYTVESFARPHVHNRGAMKKTNVSQGSRDHLEEQGMADL